jgi:hypothetical protein
MLSFLMPTCLSGHEHFELEVAPARDAVRAPGHEEHAVPIVLLKEPFGHASHVPLEPCFPTPHVATHGRPVSGPPLAPGS